MALQAIGELFERSERLRFAWRNDFTEEQRSDLLAEICEALDPMADEAPRIAQETPLDRAIREAQREAEKLTPQERRDRDLAALCLAIWSH